MIPSGSTIGFLSLISAPFRPILSGTDGYRHAKATAATPFVRAYMIKPLAQNLARNSSTYSSGECMGRFGCIKKGDRVAAASFCLGAYHRSGDYFPAEMASWKPGDEQPKVQAYFITGINPAQSQTTGVVYNQGT